MSEKVEWSETPCLTHTEAQHLSDQIWSARNPDNLVQGFYDRDDLIRTLDQSDQILADAIAKLSDWRLKIMERRLRIDGILPSSLA